LLKKLHFTPFSQEEVKPKGWLLRQLQIQAEGLSGNLDKVWPDIRDSQWIGGEQDGWERVPYWLDGFIPLAYLLDDEDLKQRAKRYIDGILERQESDGWLCPCKPEARATYDVWAFILILKVLAMYADLSGDKRVPDAVYDGLKCLDVHIRKHTLFNWASTRWYETLIPIFWLYQKKEEQWLIDLAYKLRAQGTDYTQVFEPYLDQEPNRYWTLLTHVVNLAMCLKQEALVSRLLGGDPDAFAINAHDTLLKYHGMAVHHFTGDECVAGDSPVQGSELCSVVEAMYSFEHLLSISGNPLWADKTEVLAFNALPATNSHDMWTHQYDQQTNQIRCQRLPEDNIVFGTNGADAHLFGLEPNFGCCTANFNQAWPKFAMSTFMKSEKGIANTLIAPSKVTFQQNGIKVAVTLETEYPFRNTARYIIEADAAVSFELALRIPSRADGAQVNGAKAKPGTFHLIEKEWKGREVVEVEYSYDCKLEQRPRDMHVLWRGPLLYSVAVESEFKKLEYTTNGVERKFPYCDYEISPISDWNYGFTDQNFEVSENPIGDYPFAPDNTPVEISAMLAPIDWPEEHGVCLPEPRSRKAIAEARKVRMIPYGCTYLRMTEMPTCDKNKGN